MSLCSKRHLTEPAVNTLPTAERLGMAPNDAQLLIAHARNEADHPAFKVGDITNRCSSISNPVGVCRRIFHCKYYAHIRSI